jgi:hypothetical protein
MVDETRNLPPLPTNLTYGSAGASTPSDKVLKETTSIDQENMIVQNVFGKTDPNNLLTPLGMYTWKPEYIATGRGKIPKSYKDWKPLTWKQKNKVINIWTELEESERVETGMLNTSLL